MDGVVRRRDHVYDDGLVAATRSPMATIDLIALADDLLPLAVTGRISDEQWRDRVLARLGGIAPSLDIPAAVAVWDAPIGHVDDAVTALIRQWRQHVPVVLVRTSPTSVWATSSPPS